jgi:hypothetical protein
VAATKKKTGCLTWVIAGIFALAILSAIISRCASDSTTTTAAPTPAAPTPTIDKSEKSQAERKRLIDDLQKRGILGDVQCRTSGATTVVGRGFAQLDFEAKQSFLGVVYAWCFDGSQSYVTVTLKDIGSNKQVGVFSKELGLKLD